MKHCIAVVVAVCALGAFACTGMYAGRKASADGTVLIGRTVDTPPWSCCFRAVRVPRGEGVKYAYVCTPAVTAVGKGFFPSACANEAGLVISGTVTGHTRKEILDIDPKAGRYEGVGEFNMPGLVAANCATAREALDYFAKVIAERGHFGAEIYMFADRDEAWYLEVYSGHQWAAVKMPEDKVACFGNQFMIRSFDPDSPDVRHSPELVSMPEKAGLLVRGADGLPDLCLTYATPLGDYSNYRTWFGHKTFSPSTAGEYETKRPMPLFYAPARKVSIDDMFELMRARYEGTDRCPDEGGSPKVRTIGTTKQATSHVISLDPRLPAKFAGTVWFSLANSEHSVFLPMNAAVAETDAAFAQDDAAKPFAYNPALAGHAFRRLCALAEQNRRFYGRGVRAWWRARERELLVRHPKALAAAVAKDDASIVTDFAKREQARALADARRIFDELMWYVMENNRIEGDGGGATTLPKEPFRPKGPAEVRVDFDRAIGPVKPVNGVGQPPMVGQLDSWSMMHYLREAGIPYSRLHDVGGWLGHGLYVDIPNLFPDFDADENDPKNYRFAYTDELMKALEANGVEPFFRLGVTIENFAGRGLPPVNIIPPKDYAKWGRIAEHVIRHYVEGWANGFKMKVTYWEIWNEPDNYPDPKDNCMWRGDWESYMRFYGTVAPYLKSKFPHLKIGGYGGCGFYAAVGSDNVPAANSSPRMEYFVACARRFLAAARDGKWPLDFFSFHSYSAPAEAMRQVRFADELLNEYDFTADRCERIFNEWLPYVGHANLGSARQAAGIAAELIGLQNGPCDLACIYDAKCGIGNYAPLFNPLTYKPHKAYYAFAAFNELRRRGNAVAAQVSGDGDLWVAAAKDGDDAVVMIANDSDRAAPVSCDLQGRAVVSCRITDEDRTDAKVQMPAELPPHSFVLLNVGSRK